MSNKKLIEAAKSYVSSQDPRKGEHGTSLDEARVIGMEQLLTHLQALSEAEPTHYTSGRFTDSQKEALMNMDKEIVRHNTQPLDSAEEYLKRRNIIEDGHTRFIISYDNPEMESIDLADLMESYAQEQMKGVRADIEKALSEFISSGHIPELERKLKAL